MVNTRRDLALLFDEAVAFYFRLRRFAASLHGFGELSGARRTVLITLARSGPQTVAHMARARGESRQRFQPLVNALLAEGLLRRLPNPMHRQSPLLSLSSRGAAVVRQIQRAEDAERATMRVDVSARAVRAAVETLQQVRLAIDAHDALASSRLPARPAPRRRARPAAGRTPGLAAHPTRSK